MIKSYKIRIYPTKEQEKLIWQHIGACRFVYNYFLAWEQKQYEAGEKYCKQFGFNYELTKLKQQEEYKWLYNVSNASLQLTLSDLNNAYQNFFSKRDRCPKFKSKKKSKNTYPVCTNRFYIKDNKFQIQKLGKVKFKTDFNLPRGREIKFSNVRLSYNKATNKYFISFGLECENQVQELNDYNVGIDLGVKELAIISYDGNSKVYHNINKSKKMKELTKRLKHLQRAISRKYEANKQGNKFVKTNNILRAEEDLLKLYNKISNIRDNYIHQTTHEIITLKPKQVIMEDLNVTGMMKNRHLSRAIQEQNFAKFIAYMKYKCEWNGIEFIQVDRFYPSSKMCSNCGSIKKDLKLSDRTYICPECGTIIDRDLNAAINLEHYSIG